ncbi:MAG TPA: DUF222 domain-containing protein [Candidatus Dormibacteraeota bacterium]
MHSELSSPPDLYPLTPKLEELGRRRRGIDLEELEWSRLAAEVAASGEHQKYGFFNPVDWLRVTFAMGEGVVRDRITVGRQMDRLPMAVAAVESGEIGFAHLVVLARTAEALKERPVDEAKLLVRAREQTVGRFHYTCESYRHQLDAEGVAAEAEDLHEKRELTIRRRRDGMFTIWGRLEPVTGSALRAALAPHARRRDRGDARTFPQRLHDAVTEHLAGRQTTNVNVTVSLETMLAPRAPGRVRSRARPCCPSRPSSACSATAACAGWCSTPSRWWSMSAAPGGWSARRGGRRWKVAKRGSAGARAAIGWGARSIT